MMLVLTDLTNDLESSIYHYFLWREQQELEFEYASRNRPDDVVVRSKKATTTKKSTKKKKSKKLRSSFKEDTDDDDIGENSDELVREDEPITENEEFNPLLHPNGKGSNKNVTRTTARKTVLVQATRQRTRFMKNKRHFDEDSEDEKIPIKSKKCGRPPSTRSTNDSSETKTSSHSTTTTRDKSQEEGASANMHTESDDKDPNLAINSKKKRGRPSRTSKASFVKNDDSSYSTTSPNEADDHEERESDEFTESDDDDDEVVDKRRTTRAKSRTTTTLLSLKYRKIIQLLRKEFPDFEENYPPSVAKSIAPDVYKYYKRGREEDGRSVMHNNANTNDDEDDDYNNEGGITKRRNSNAKKQWRNKLALYKIQNPNDTYKSFADIYKQLMSYYHRYGHCRVPIEENPILAKWISKIRLSHSFREGIPKTLYHFYEQPIPVDKLNQDRIDLLNDIGFEWKDANVSSAGVKGKTSTTTVAVSKVGETDDENNDVNNDPSMTPDVKPLDKAKVPKHVALAVASGEKQQLKWFGRFQQLTEFKRQYGHTIVPYYNNDTNLSLATWVAKQRAEYKNQSLSENKKSKLDSIGFQWKFHRTFLLQNSDLTLQYYTDKSFEERIEQCLQAPYRKLLPNSDKYCIDIPPLNRIVRKYKPKIDGDKSSKKKRKTRSQGTSRTAQQEEYDKLTLQLWADTMRREYKLLKQVAMSENSSVHIHNPTILNEEQITQLNDIGFIWDYEAYQKALGGNNGEPPSSANSVGSNDNDNEENKALDDDDDNDDIKSTGLNGTDTHENDDDNKSTGLDGADTNENDDDNKPSGLNDTDTNENPLFV